MSKPLLQGMPTATHALTREQELHWLALRMTPGLGTRSAGQLIQKLRTPEAIFRASATELAGHGLARSIAQSIASGCAFEDAADQQNKLAEFDSQIIPITDPRYPRRLREIYGEWQEEAASLDEELRTVPIKDLVGVQYAAALALLDAVRRRAD